MKYHADAATTHLADLAVAESEQIPAFKDNLSTLDPSGRTGNKSQNRESRDGFTAATFTHNGKRFTLFDSIGDSVNSFDDRVFRTEVGSEILYLKNFGHDVW